MRMKEETLDTFGVPEHYATEVGVIEEAGGGNVRVVRCIRRSGILIPVYSVITPVAQLLADMALVRDKTGELFQNVNSTDMYVRSARLDHH